MRRTFYLIMLMQSLCFFANAQQEIQVSHNMYNHLDVNPAYAGMSGAYCATLIARQQWVGWSDAQGNKGFPRTYLLSLDAPINRYIGGVGLTVIQDQLGFEKNQEIKLSVSKHINVGNAGVLGLGGQFIFESKHIDFTKFIAMQDGDQLLANGTNNERGEIIDFALGAFYMMPDNLYFGFSVSQIRQADFSLTNVLAMPGMKRHYYVDAGKYIQLNRRFELAPSILIKSDLASTQFDLTALLKYEGRFWGGLGWRTTDAIAVFVGMTFMDSGLCGYSYDITTSPMGADGRSYGSHEIVLRYCFKPKKTYQSHETVRFLAPSFYRE